jgi:hypothetical protein
MLIVYCDACNLRILQKDLDSGGVVQIEENKYLCAKCAPAQAKAPTGPTPAASRETPSQMRVPSGEIRQSKTTVRTLRASDRTSGAVAPASGSASAARRAALPPEGAEKPKSLMVPMLAGGAGLLIFLVGIFVALSGKNETHVASASQSESKPPAVQTAAPTTPMSPDALKKLNEPTAPAAGDDTAKPRNLPSWMQTDNVKKDGEQRAGTVDLQKKQTAGPPEAGNETKRLTAFAEAQKKENDEIIFCDDGVPIGAKLGGTSESDSWKWVQKPDPVFSGTYAHTSNGPGKDGTFQHHFVGAGTGLKVNPSDVLFAYVYIDPKSPPKEIMMQWHLKAWEQRAYWGENVIPWGQNFSPSRLPMGDLPKSGEWVRLEVPASQIGVDAPAVVTGWSFDHVGGQVYWDKAGVQVKPAAVATNDPKSDKAGPTPPNPPTPPPQSTPASVPVGGGNAFAQATNGDAAAPVKILCKDFKGGGDFNDFHGSDKRPSKAIWGRNTKKSKITATFTMPPGDYSVGMLHVTSIRHSAKDPCDISITLNGQEIFKGKERSKSAGLHWGEEDYEIGSGVLKAGTNELMISNIEDSANEHGDPWYMINNVEIRATLNPEKAFPPIISEVQRAKLQLYEKALEALVKKDPEVVAKLEGVVKIIGKPVAPAANVFAATENKEGEISLPLAGGVERALELHSQALEAFRKKPPSDPITVEKLKSTGTISRVDGSKVFVKAGGIELSIDISSIPANVMYKTLAIDESKPAGLNDKAAWLLGLGHMEDVQAVLKKVPKDARAPWTTFFADYTSLDKLTKFDAALTNAQQMLAHGKADTALILLNNAKKEYPEFLEANQERLAFLTKRLEGLQKK